MQSETTHETPRRTGFIIVAATLAALSGAVVSGCNTVEGAGDDIEAAGDAISDTARDAND